MLAISHLVIDASNPSARQVRNDPQNVPLMHSSVCEANFSDQRIHTDRETVILLITQREPDL